MTGNAGIAFDFTINLTTIAGVVIWAVTLALAWAKFGGRMDVFDVRLQNVENTLRTLAVILEKFAGNEKDIALLQQEIATIAQQFTTLHSTVERMRVGEGFIRGPRRGNIEGEYPSRVVDNGHR